MSCHAIEAVEGGRNGQAGGGGGGGRSKLGHVGQAGSAAPLLPPTCVAVAGHVQQQPVPAVVGQRHKPGRLLGLGPVD